jgi:hypothetical protein
MVLELRWVFKLIMYGYKPLITDARKASKQYTQNVRLHYVSTKPQCYILEDQDMNSHTVNLQVLHIFSV